MNIKNRVRYLEDKMGSCSECRFKPQRICVVYPQEGDHTPDPERCPSCDRPLGFVIRVLYEGEGGRS